MHPVESPIAFGAFTVARLPREVGLEDAEQYLGALKQASVLELDWRAVQRIERVAGCVLVSVLVGTLDDVPLRVRLPQSTYARTEVLDRAGLLFALAQRTGAVEHDGGNEFTMMLNKWRAAGAHIQMTWDPSKAIGGLETAHRSHAWTNLHQGLENYSGDDFGDAMRTWLELDVLHSRTAHLSTQLVDDIAVVSSELLENVMEHASRGVEFSGGPRSLAHAMITEGGTGSHDRLYLTMQDNGRGIERTARPKLGLRENALPGEQILTGLVDGSLVTFPSPRGRGLPKIWGAASRRGGTFQIATGHLRLLGKAGELRSHTSSTFVDGSAIVLMFPLRG